MANKTLTLGSLFDGSAGFPLGGLINGITPLWASEVEPFCIRVTTKRLPQMKHYGDVSALNGADLPPVDIITFGSPCQDMSIAGKRSGLDGARSSLFYQAVRIVKEMRCKTNGQYPRFVVWENVPGAFSSNKGADFKAVLEALCRVKSEDYAVPEPPEGRWDNAGSVVGEDFSLAWRLFDAQYWGVPQRRKRIYLVADFDGGSAGKILFESEGVSGYTPQGFRSWQAAAGGAEESTGAAGLCLNDQGCGSPVETSQPMAEKHRPSRQARRQRMEVTEDVTNTLRAEAHHPPCVMESAGFCTEHSAKSRGIGYEEETSPTLRAGTVPAAALVFENHSQDTRYKGPLNVAQTVLSTYGTGGNNQPFVVETPKTLKIRSGCEGGGKGALVQDDLSATLGCSNDQTVFVPFGICSKASHSMLSDNPKSGFYEAETSRCLDANGGNPSCNQGGMAVVTWCMTTGSFTQTGENRTPPLMARDYKDPPIISGSKPEYIVRRLTPTECARLQGFPDWWCSDLGTEEPTEEDIAFWAEVFETHRRITGASGKPKTRNQIVKWLQDPHSDSAEYKMWGNGVALPNVCFVLAGIAFYDSAPPQ